MTPSNDDRIAYLAGEDVASLRADELAALDAVRTELGAAATWDEPPGDLEDQIVMAVSRAVAQERGPERAPSPPWWSRLRARLPMRHPVRALSLSVAAAAAVAIVLVTSSDTTTPRAPVRDGRRRGRRWRPPRTARRR